MCYRDISQFIPKEEPWPILYKQRHFPADFTVVKTGDYRAMGIYFEEWSHRTTVNGTNIDVHMGEHSFSWLTLSELGNIHEHPGVQSRGSPLKHCVEALKSLAKKYSKTEDEIRMVFGFSG